MKASQLWGFISLLIFIFRLRPSMAGGEKENPLIETHSNLVEMAGYGEDKLSSVLVIGSVNCEAVLDGESEPHSWPVSGAKVAVTCKRGRQNRNPDSTQGWTDEYGDFIIDLPSRLHAIPSLEKSCSVRIFYLPKITPCKQVFVRKPRGLRLTSLGNGIRTYTTGMITFQQPPNKP
ncbi:uncharacterized protein LOC122093796 [Macadamia integrifolia]|uniref:uncharacterized protein LOC122093796 n=1 Tax=Macadamia integrifolia TaxID=60698 RepID=UPI001C4F5917|nr:uncharacterized protein LOC122093796 [Macadamia integrifolia]